jgi:hypothetical protein
MEIFTGLSRFIFLALLSLFMLEILRILNKDLNKGERARKTCARSQAYLIVTAGHHLLGIPADHGYVLEEMLTVGRSSDNDVVADSQFVSGSHAAIYKKEGSYYAKDLGSKNGTLLNGNPLGGQERPLSDGDQVQIGEIIFSFERNRGEA